MFENQWVFGLLRQRAYHRFASIGETSIPEERPGEQVLTVHVVTRFDVGARAREHMPPFACASVIEDKQAPRAMNGAGLLERTHLHRLRVLRRGRAVAELTVCVADNAEHRWIELNRDRAITVFDR